MKWPDMLLSTTFKIFLYKSKNNKFEILHDKLNGYYGITWDKENMYFSTADSVYGFHENLNNVIETLYRQSIKKLGSPVDIHQILYKAGNIYIANTKLNKIDIFNTIRAISTHALIGAQRADINHINSIFFTDDNIYVCFHNGHQPSMIQKLDEHFKLLCAFVKVGYQIHNVYVDDKYIYTLHSKLGCLVYIDPKTNIRKSVQIAGTHGIPPEYKFARGLAKTKDYFFIGVNHLTTIRDERENSLAWIVALNNNLEYVDKIRVPIQAQAKEIRVISEPDLAHNGIDFPLRY